MTEKGRDQGGVRFLCLKKRGVEGKWLDGFAIEGEGGPILLQKEKKLVSWLLRNRNELLPG